MDRTTVDALKALGKALCGDSFEVTPGLTDAEMIFEIAKQYEAPEGGGGDEGSGGETSEPMIVTGTVNVNPNDSTQYTITLTETWKTIADAWYAGQPVIVEYTVNGAVTKSYVITLVTYADYYSVIIGTYGTFFDGISLYTDTSTGYPAYTTS